MINELLSKINLLDSRIKEIEGYQDKFDSLHFDLKTSDETIGQLEVEYKKINSEFKATENLLSIWDDWRLLKDSQSEILSLPVLESFPENAIERYNSLEDRLDELSINLSDIEFKISDILDKQKHIQIDERLIENRKEIMFLANSIEKYRADKNEVLSDGQKLASLEVEFEILKREIGDCWNEEILEKFDYSIPTKAEILSKRDEMEKLKKDEQEISDKLSHLKTSIKEFEQELSQNTREIELHQINLSEGEIEKQKESIRNLRKKLLQQSEKNNELQTLQRDVAYYSTSNSNLLEKPQKAPNWPAGMILLAGIVAFYYNYIAGSILSAMIAFGILFATAIGYLFAIRNNKIQDNSSEKVEPFKDYSTLIAGLNSELKDIKQSLFVEAKICGFDDIPDATQIEVRADVLDKSTQQLRDFRHLETNRDVLKSKISAKEKEYSEYESALLEKRTELDRQKDQWKNWLASNGLNNSLIPEVILDVFSLIKTYDEKKRSIGDTAARIEERKSFLAHFEDRVRSVFEKCSREPPTDSFEIYIQDLIDDVEKTVEEKRKHEQLTIDYNHLIETKKADEKKHAEFKSQLTELLKAGFAETEEHFLKNVSIWKTISECKSNIKNSERQISNLFGDREKYEWAIQELETNDHFGLMDKNDKLEDKIKELNESLNKERDKRGGIRKEIVQLEANNDGILLRMEKLAHQEKVNENAREWAKLVLAQEILEHAIKCYEKERQPSVIKESQTFFSKITSGRYSRIFVPFDSSDVFVEDYDGKQKDVSQLSRGTAEQLYLALRFGFIKELGKHKEALPVIFDDIMVNFDPERSKNACEAIKELTNTNQVLYFTCHPQTIDLLLDVMPDTKVIDISA